MFLSPRFDHGSSGMRTAGVAVYVAVLAIKLGLICVTIMEAHNVRPSLR